MSVDDGFLEAQFEVRDDLSRALAADLIGPRLGADEILDDPPLDHYVTAILYPLLGDAAAVEESARDDTPDDDGDRASDPAVAMSNVHYPSSAGITFGLDLAVKDLRVVVEAARYLRREDGRWQREPIGPLPIDLTLDGPPRLPVVDGLVLYVNAREATDATRAVTVALLNEQQGRAGEKDGAAFFQVWFGVEDPAGGAPFVARPRRLELDDRDLRSNELLYRDRPEFAIGHGCAAEWIADEGHPRRARSVSATFLPCQDVRIVESNPEIDTDRLRFEDLAVAPAHELLASLDAFVSGYEGWIGERQLELHGLTEENRATAEEHLLECAEVRAGIEAGAAFLRDDPAAMWAFQLANRTMVDQMERRAHNGGEGGDRRSYGWRPFQLAFVLLAMPSTVVRGAADRDVVELLWFPTGGGKTEAYLALFAFTTFYRRLTRGGAGGVTAIMRYTLRLLTAQQFERAARVICACERIRRGEPDLGEMPISIGLFVGSSSTPNTLDEAREALNALRAGQTVPTKNPVQLRACPWCDLPLDHRHYAIRENPRRLQIECRNPDCDFAAGLPVHVVDEDLYREHPTLVIGTVDKFAALPWRPRVGNLFNLDDPALPPPDLIIQDELHLISGPLGTMTGLYETIIDELGSESGRPPKVVASTATIRRARQQSNSLFARRMRQFPPAGIDPDDNWFATVAPPASRGPRRYLGVMAPGVSHATLMIRCYAALLHAAAGHEAGPAVDPYWTLIGYFNSLRVLGAARMQVQDDVQDRMRTISGADGPGREPDAVELTSRVDSADIPDRLGRLAVEMPDPRAIDVVLATNMISVGVDVDRLGLMVVMGQPQAAAEYIQATSRVGRRHPGLVVDLFNAGRSRDRSHFEGFTAFHQALYRSVEPTSVTPFSPRARDRGLHAVLIALARLRIPALRDEEGAARIGDHLEELEPIVDGIVERAARIDPEQATATAAQLRDIVERWRQRAETDPGLVYWSVGHTGPSLLTAAPPDSESLEMSTMWSLRDVDAQSNLYFPARPR
jgi:hypothetical protein